MKSRLLILATLLALTVACSSAKPGVSALRSALQQAQSTSTTEVPASVAQGWLAKFCQAEPGMTPAALTDLMGPPTDVVNGNYQWWAYEWAFDAWLGSNGNVHELAINDIRLNAAEKAAIPCDEVRE